MGAEVERRRIVLLFSVLAGLFLMHGFSAGGVGGCHAAPSEMVMAQPAMSPAVPSHANEHVTVGGMEPISQNIRAGETCVPLRPEGLSGLFLALFLIVIALWRPRLPQSARLIRPHWPHGPPRTGAEILRTLSIFRT